MEKNDLEKLITKYLSGKGSREENLEVEKWYASFETDAGLTNKLTDSEKEALESKLLHRIDQKISSLEGKKAAPVRSFRIFGSDYKIRPVYAYSYKIAAVFIGLLMMAVISYESFVSKTVVYSTGYGETHNIVLPDGSTVMLNGNSTLRYENELTTEGTREVYLDGEAFFSVTHTKSKQKFIVNISDKMNVEVLGTKFNISKRKSATRVVLNSGNILLNLKEPEGTEPVMMNPGELVEFNENSAEYVKKKVNVEVYSAWKNHKLIFDNTTLQQVLIMLEENYGLKSHISDMDLLNQKVSGTIPAENIEILLKNISITYGLDILTKEDSIEIKKASSNN